MVHFLIGRAAKRVAGWLGFLHIARLAYAFILWIRGMAVGGAGSVVSRRLLARTRGAWSSASAVSQGCSFSADWNVLASLARMI